MNDLTIYDFCAFLSACIMLYYVHIAFAINFDYIYFMYYGPQSF